MLVPTFELDGSPGPALDLRREDPTTMAIGEQPVLAVSHWGAYMALTLPHKLVLVRVADYEQLVGYMCGLHGLR